MLEDGLGVEGSVGGWTGSGGQCWSVGWEWRAVLESGLGAKGVLEGGMGVKGSVGGWKGSGGSVGGFTGSGGQCWRVDWECQGRLYVECAEYTSRQPFPGVPYPINPATILAIRQSTIEPCTRNSS